MATHTTKQKVPGPVDCDFCDLQRICQVLECIHDDLPKVSVHIVQKGGTIYRAGSRAERLYAVRKGMLKSVAREADRTRLVSVHLPGEMVGLDAVGTRTLTTDIVAVTPTIYCAIPLAAFERASYERMPLLAAAVAQLRAAERARELPNTSGTLAERVGAFFTNIAERLAARGMDAEGLDFDVTREELAHHFERRVGSMRRALDSAKDSGVIRLQDNKIQLSRRSYVSARTRPLHGHRPSQG